MPSGLIYTVQKNGVQWLAGWPLKRLYRLSDLLFPLIYYIMRYRRGLVWQNLVRSFPEKNLHQIRAIEKGYYQYLGDQFVETLKAFRMDDKELRQRVTLENPEILSGIFERGQSVMHLLGHHANWEWYAKILAMNMKHTLWFVYKPLNQDGFEHLLAGMRQTNGIEVIPMKEVSRRLTAGPERPVCCYFGADQSPTAYNRFMWIPFLHQPTAVFLGAEELAKRHNMAVVYGSMRRMKRGHYSISMELLTDHPADLEPGEITRWHTAALERLLQDQPQYWLWSHNRWKLNPNQHPGVSSGIYSN
ncbi:MAG: lysophospholipid acyltransferase family protein [Sphingomonadales bacterium]|nr:lysophospholipid acyltransferase family protein [Sphingomonadales bacterium]